MEMKKPILILIGGAPGIGKSTVAELLYQHLENSVWLDGDDLWRMHPFIVNDQTKLMVLDNIGCVLGSFLKASFEYVILSWVMHEPQIVDAILDRLKDCEFSLVHFTLGCREHALLNRIANASRARDPELCLDRLAATMQNYPDVIDTGELSPEGLLQLIIQRLEGEQTGSPLQC